MPRPPRLHVPGGCYHVILRGNHREPLFGDAADRNVLSGFVADVVERFNARIHAFCWMTNHLHALVQIADRPLGGMMQRIALRYSRYRHKALRTTGHLFERRYRAKLVDVDAYFLTLVRYIHLNPVKANIVQDPSDYPWSSHRAYLGLDSLSWLTTDFGLSLFSSDLDLARTAYARFMLLDRDGQTGDPDHLSHPQDPRILGTDTFVSKIPLAPYRPRGLITLEQLAHSFCESHHTSIDWLRSPSRSRSLAALRAAFTIAAVEQRISTLSDVARFLHRDPSSLSRLLARHTTKRSNP